MIRSLSSLIGLLLLCSCATPENSYTRDIALEWESSSAKLYVYSPNGSQLPSFGKETLTLPGYLFSGGAVILHPGEQGIGFGCPQPNATVIPDIVPTVKFNFEAGHSYELRCKDGRPVISDRRSGA
jgi:hypothetical protein